MNNFNLLNNIKEEYITKRSLDKDEILFKEGDRCEYVGVLIKGSLSISSYSFSGREIVYKDVQINELFGNNLIFSNEPFYKGNVISKSSKTLVYLINKENLIKLLQEDKEFLLNFLSIQSENGILTNIKIKLLSFDKAEDRLLYYLYQNNGHIKFKTVTDLAKFLFIERETLSRLLTKLEKENIINRSGKTIRLN